MSILGKNFLMPQSATPDPSAGWDATRSAMVADFLRGTNLLPRGMRMRVHGQSMLPAVWPGTEVEIEPCSLEELRRGDIVLAHRCDGDRDHDRLFLHRFIAADSNRFVLRGDSMPHPDPPYPAEALLGRMIEGRSRRWSASFLSRAVGFFLCHCGGARRFALRLHRRNQASAFAFGKPGML